MQRQWLALWIVCAAAFAVGCGARDAPSSLPPKAEQAQASAPAAEDEAAAQDMPSEPQPADDDLAPPAKHGLVRGLEKLQQTIPVERARPSQKTVNLREADDLLTSAKSQNMAAIREANRQVRIAGRGINLVLFIVTGLRCADLACYGKAAAHTPHLDKLAAEAVRYANFRPEGPQSDAFYWSLMTGLHARRPAPEKTHVLRPADLTLSRMLWNAGYSTELLGDCSLRGAIAPDGATGLDFDSWSGYRDPAQTHPAWPEQFWYQGNPARVLDNADGKHGRHASELLRQEIVRSLRSSRQGRPSFLCVAWPRFAGAVSTTDAALDAESLGRLDLTLGAMADQWKALGVERKTVLLLLGDGDLGLGSTKGEEVPSAQLRPLPLMVWAPQRFAAGVREHLCDPCCILPTLADLADARRRPKVQEGVSLVPSLRGSGPRKK